MNKIGICVVGWYYFSKFYKQLEGSEFEVFVVAHRYNKILDKHKLKYFVKDNVGVEYGAYNYYINNIWKKGYDVFFMHDDIDFLKFDDVIFSNYKILKKKNIDNASIVHGRHVSYSERFFYMSSKFTQIMVEEYGGVWYDKENLGYTSRKAQPSHWHPRRYNLGGLEFKKRSIDIEKKYKIKIRFTLRDERVTLYHRGKKKIKGTYNSKEKEQQRLSGNRQKKQRKLEEKNFNSKF